MPKFAAVAGGNICHCSGGATPGGHVCNFQIATTSVASDVKLLKCESVTSSNDVILNLCSTLVTLVTL